MKHIAIGPGGIGYFSLIGAMNKLHDDGELDCLESMSGSSAGSLVCVMCAVYGFDFKQILKRSIEVNLKFNYSIKNFITSYGLIDKQSVLCMMNTCIPNITFQELYTKCPIKIYITSYCLEMKKNIYISVDTHPTLSIIDALYMSISIPLIFEPIRINNLTYLDGGLIEDSPCSMLLDKDDIGILRLKYDSYIKCDTIYDYMMHMFETFLLNRKNYTYKTYAINLKSFNILNYKLSDSEKMKLFTHGYNNIYIY